MLSPCPGRDWPRPQEDGHGDEHHSLKTHRPFRYLGPHTNATYDDHCQCAQPFRTKTHGPVFPPIANQGPEPRMLDEPLVGSRRAACKREGRKQKKGCRRKQRKDQTCHPASQAHPSDYDIDPALWRFEQIGSPVAPEPGRGYERLRILRYQSRFYRWGCFDAAHPHLGFTVGEPSRSAGPAGSRREALSSPAPRYPFREPLSIESG